jgi:L-fuconate dehydratase
VDLTPEQIVGAIDFTYLTDALTPEQALELLQKRVPTRAAREAEMRADGFPAYTTSTGWLGYSDEKVRRLCAEAKAAGFTDFKMKVGMDLDANMRRAALMRESIGSGRLMMDANQCWDVDEAIRQMKALARFDPYWIEEPTSPDDVYGHARIRAGIGEVKVATGEMCQNRILFKQFIMNQAIDVVQIDACRLGGVNEVLAVLLMAAKYELPVCPHAGGVGLCEYVQHLSMIDYLCFAGTTEGRVIEYVDHLHEHFVEPCVIRDAAYMPPLAPGFSIEMKSASLARFEHSPRPPASLKSA